MILYYDKRFDTIVFGIDELKKALYKKNIFYVEKELRSFLSTAKEQSIVASFEGQGVRKVPEGLKEGGFEIYVDGNIIYVTGKDHRGLMYGLLDIAETIGFFGVSSIKSKVENPFLSLRGIKYNLPFEPYDTGTPFEKNYDTCLSIDYWRDYIDFLARNRYNCLSLWSEHPFHMMFRLEKYPQTCPYSDVELERYKELYKFIMGHAQNRGIDVYLITWNIRITPFVAKGLGLPPEIGDMLDQYDIVYDNCNKIPNNTHEFDAVRQHLPVIKDYFKECIKTLVITYKDLKGIGTNCAEEMVGSAEERQDWVIDTYLESIKESGRDIPFIMRTNMGNGKVAKAFMDKYPGQGKYISWKYSNAHMYSSTHPQFERLWGAWDGVNMDEVKVLYTVRNDDIHTLRWGDNEFLRDYIKGMKKPYVHGFYWGADGYTWGEDFQHVPHGHKTSKYNFEKHWHQFELIGRLGYNPDMAEEILIEKYKLHYGKLWGEKFYNAMKYASKIIPAVNRLHWINYDFEWHPESLLSVFGFKTILDFMGSKPMPGIGTVGIREYVEKKLSGMPIEGETREDIIEIIRQSVEKVGYITKELKDEIPHEYLAGELVCTLMDLEAWRELGNYYANKFEAALNLVYFQSTGDEAYKDRAVKCLEEGKAFWAELSRIWSQHYMPYKMTRVKYTFGWPYYMDDVEKDIDIARNMEFRK